MGVSVTVGVSITVGVLVTVGVILPLDVRCHCPELLADALTLAVTVVSWP